MLKGPSSGLMPPFAEAIDTPKDRQLDSSTVQNHILGIAAWTEHVASMYRLAVHSPPPLSPMRDDSIKLLLDSIVAFKKKSKATTALTLEEARIMLHSFADDLRGRHHELIVAYPLLGMLRQQAAKHLIVRYHIDTAELSPRVVFAANSDIIIFTKPDGSRYMRIRVDVDKNIKEGAERFAYVPEYIHGLHYNLIERTIEYILLARPPSGTYLLAGLKGGKRPKAGHFYPTPFASFAKVWRDTFRRMFPSQLDKKVASHSGRKTLATLLWNDGWCRRVIADAGGWFMKRDAVDLYFKTDPETILYALSHLGERLGLQRVGAAPAPAS